MTGVQTCALPIYLDDRQKGEREMNYESIIVVSVVLALAALAAWRVAKKGTPCECGGSRKACGGGCCCCDGEKKK